MANILIVEDEKVLRDAYKLTLERDGHSIRLAANGKEALEAATAEQPDIILLDILMPEMNGLEFLEKYDVLRNHPEVKVVVLSNVGQDHEVGKAIDLGAYKYIVKAHASPQDLSALVKHLIRKNLDKTPA
ncbi:MAG TPA: response regulator [Candidatus Saccharimonadales bacterium]|nr:response regulator [Candidatus Saccharimonadales bacterium]